MCVLLAHGETINHQICVSLHLFQPICPSSEWSWKTTTTQSPAFVFCFHNHTMTHQRCLVKVAAIKPVKNGFKSLFWIKFRTVSPLLTTHGKFGILHLWRPKVKKLTFSHLRETPQTFDYSDLMLLVPSCTPLQQNWTSTWPEASDNLGVIRTTVVLQKSLFLVFPKHLVCLIEQGVARIKPHPSYRHYSRK